MAWGLALVAVYVYKNLAPKINLPMALVRMGFLPQRRGEGGMMKIPDELLILAVKKAVDLELLPKWGDMETHTKIYKNMEIFLEWLLEKLQKEQA